MLRTVRLAPLLLALIPLCALFAARRGQSVPLYAARTGNMCGTCHFDPNGGGPRNDFGFGFARNRHSLSAEDTTSEWRDLSVTNRIGEAMPVYLGLNQRFMLIANTTQKSDSLDRLGFFNMENSIHMTFVPHRRLTLVYSRDGFDSGSSTKDAFGMISGFGWNGYFKAGRFRTPFGLRMDDHTVATRNSFLDFYDQPKRFLPYDPRNPDMGYEVGADNSEWFGRLAFTDGGTHPLGFLNTNAQAVTAKLGMNRPEYQGAISFYDDFHRELSPLGTPVPTRSTRWGYYGMTHWQQLAFLGEIAAGTDLAWFLDSSGLALVSAKTNLLAGFAEMDWAPHRAYNLRLRYDRAELDRSTNPVVRDPNDHDRYALEGEWVPVPFAEMRWAMRVIHHGDPAEKDEHQAFVQMHFSY